ncbi:MAG: sigma-70 family RNA polymerase sigma factor [Gemmatimonadaceae bacterium]|nr:sigma-70 family RNA polymerase sigma factor [Gemmatimonadaceae bacterium]
MDDEAITDLLLKANAGDAAAAARVMPLVYDALHRIAARRVRPEHAQIGATSLVHEMYLKLFHEGGLDVTSRSHFYALASAAMRQIMLDKARAHLRDKRGGAALQVTLDDEMASVDAQCEMAIALDDAIDRLERFDPRLERVVVCRFFGGLTEEETALALGVTSRTIRSDWVKARALLRTWLTH